jgi:hypothetical protein
MAAILTVTISGIITATIFGPGTDGTAIFPTGAIPGIPILGAIRAFTVSGSLSDIPQDPGYLFLSVPRAGLAFLPASVRSGLRLAGAFRRKGIRFQRVLDNFSCQPSKLSPGFRFSGGHRGRKWGGGQRQSKGRLFSNAKNARVLAAIDIENDFHYYIINLPTSGNRKAEPEMETKFREQFAALLEKYTELLLGKADEELQEKVRFWILYQHISKSMPNLARHWNALYPEAKAELRNLILEIKQMNEDHRKRTHGKRDGE